MTTIQDIHEKGHKVILYKAKDGIWVYMEFDDGTYAAEKWDEEEKIGVMFTHTDKCLSKSVKKSCDHD